MAARLPTPGGDEGSWGTLLNSYLLESHNADGTIKAGVVNDATLTAGLRDKINNSVAASSLSAVATSGSYLDLSNRPTIPTIPTLAPVATSGSYEDLIDKPTIPTIPTLAPVATSGSYADLTGKPAVVAAGATAADARSAIGAASIDDINTTAQVRVFESYADAPALPVNTVVISLSGS